MKQVFFIFVMLCISLTGLMAQSYMTLDGKVFKNGVHVYTVEQSSSSREAGEGSLRSSGCDECRPPDVIIKPDPACPTTCKTSFCPGWLMPQLKQFSSLDTTLKILRVHIYKLTFCQKAQFELVDVIGIPSDDAIIHGREGMTFVGKDFKLDADAFYLVMLIVRNTKPGCPTWMRQELFESFYVKPCCDAGGNITSSVNLVSKRNTVVVNQKGEKTTLSKTDTTVLQITQPVSTYTKVYNDTLLVNVKPDTIIDPNSVATTSLDVCEELGEMITVTSLQDLSNLGIEVTVSPNPTADRIKLNMSLSTQDQFEKIDLYSISGQFMLSSSETEMMISELPAGMYQAVLYFKKGLTIKVNRAILKVD